MNKNIGWWVIGVLVVGIAGMVIGSQIPLFAQSTFPQFAKPCPMVMDFRQNMKAEIINVVFSEEVVGVKGNKMSIPDKVKDKQRLAVVTIKITKPPGRRLVVPAADFTLHYYHGNVPEVAPCEGISEFTATEDTARPIDLSTCAGPGFVKQQTRTRTTQAGVVYMDAVFGYMEPDTKECWICVGQPGVVEPFVTNGWSND